MTVEVGGGVREPRGGGRGRRGWRRRRARRGRWVGGEEEDGARRGSEGGRAPDTEE